MEIDGLGVSVISIVNFKFSTIYFLFLQLNRMQILKANASSQVCSMLSNMFGTREEPKKKSKEINKEMFLTIVNKVIQA